MDKDIEDILRKKIAEIKQNEYVDSSFSHVGNVVKFPIPVRPIAIEDFLKLVYKNLNLADKVGLLLILVPTLMIILFGYKQFFEGWHSLYLSAIIMMIGVALMRLVERLKVARIPFMLEASSNAASKRLSK